LHRSKLSLLLVAVATLATACTSDDARQRAREKQQRSAQDLERQLDAQDRHAGQADEFEDRLDDQVGDPGHGS